jgi:hypothetical protein
VVEHIQVWLKTRQDISQFVPEEAYPLFGSLPRHSCAKQADFTGEGIDFNDLASLFQFVVNAGLELDTAIDQVLDEGLLGGRVTGDSLSPQFLVTLSVLPGRPGLARTSLVKTT